MVAHPSTHRCDTDYCSSGTCATCSVRSCFQKERNPRHMCVDVFITKFARMSLGIFEKVYAAPHVQPWHLLLGRGSSFIAGHDLYFLTSVAGGSGGPGILRFRTRGLHYSGRTAGESCPSFSWSTHLYCVYPTLPSTAVCVLRVPPSLSLSLVLSRHPFALCLARPRDTRTRVLQMCMSWCPLQRGKTVLFA